LPGDPDDTDSRYIEAAIGGMLVGCLYLPNGNPAPGPKFDYKLRWFERLTDYAKALLVNGAPAVLAGDFNVMPTELDVYAPERWVDDALFRPEVREAYSLLVAQGWTDALRALHPDERLYTFWKYFRNAFARDAGLRIDHLLLSPPLAGRLVAAGVDRNVRARERSSDHAPVWIEIADASTGVPTARSAPDERSIRLTLASVRNRESHGEDRIFARSTDRQAERRQEGLRRSARRWVVERIFSWFGRNRRLAKTAKTLPKPWPPSLPSPSIQLALRRLRERRSVKDMLGACFAARPLSCASRRVH
jgi:exodeoxyribonuclease-3